MNPLELLLADRALALVCAVARISGLIVVAPLPWTVAPLRVRAVLVMVLAFIATSAPLPLDPTLSERPLSVLLAMLSELGIGACLGMTVRLLVATAEVAGEFIAPQLGLGVAQLFDPHTRVSETAVAALLRQLGLLVMVIAGVHRQVLAAVIGSFNVLPPGELVNPGRAGPAMLVLTASSIETGVRIALPTVAVLFMVQIALAFIARAAPALQIFSVGFAVTLGVGVLVLLVSLPDAVRMLLAETSRLDTQIQALLQSLLETPR